MTPSAETREKIRQAKLGKPNPGAKYVRSPETREKNRQGRLGKSHTDEALERMSSAHRATWQDPAYRAKVVPSKPEPLPVEERQRLARERIRLANLGRKDDAERRERVRQGVLAAYAADPSIKERLRAARLRQVFPKGQTSIERALEDEFRHLGLRFLTQYPAFERFQPDFTFPDVRLFVQADGEYWHSLPNNRRLDREFADAAEGAGWTVMRFSQGEIDQNAALCAQRVAEFIDRHC